MLSNQCVIQGNTKAVNLNFKNINLAEIEFSDN
jgi:hypothetical protein